MELHKIPIVLPEYNALAFKAKEMTISFWQLVNQHKGITKSFREIASDNLERAMKLPY